jgi:hypothetical protein
MSIQSTGQIIRDREQDASFAVHEACAKTLQEMCASFDMPHRMVEMGPMFGDFECAFAGCQVTA